MSAADADAEDHVGLRLRPDAPCAWWWRRWMQLVRCAWPRRWSPPPTPLLSAGTDAAARSGGAGAGIAQIRILSD
jgi:hypothetical protein